MEAVAIRVVELLRGEEVGSRLVDPAEMARRLNVSRDYVYANADALGVIRLGNGRKRMLRFNPARVIDELREVSTGAEVRQRSIRSSVRRAPEAELLPVKDTAQ